MEQRGRGFKKSEKFPEMDPEREPAERIQKQEGKMALCILLIINL